MFDSDSNDVLRNVPEGTTIGQLIQDRELRITLGYGDNVRALVAGVEQSQQAIVPDGGTVVIETRANSKANPLPEVAAVA